MVPGSVSNARELEDIEPRKYGFLVFSTLRIPVIIRALFVGLCIAAPLGAQTFTVGSTTATAGQTAYGRLDIAAGIDSATFIPFALIRGMKAGKTVAVLSGAHGTEYASIVAAQRVIPRIDAKRLSGTVIIVPLINRASFERMRVHMNPVDEKSMNGNYPGKPTGTQTERALDLVAREVIQCVLFTLARDRTARDLFNSLLVDEMESVPRD